MDINNVLFILVAFLWGITNPIIKKESKGITKIKCKSKIQQFLQEVLFLATNWKYVITFLVNQTGSVLYIYALKYTELSIVVPIVNSLTFAITAIFGRFFGEKPGNLNTFIGVLFIVLGTTVCVLS